MMFVDKGTTLSCHITPFLSGVCLQIHAGRLFSEWSSNSSILPSYACSHFCRRWGSLNDQGIAGDSHICDVEISSSSQLDSRSGLHQIRAISPGNAVGPEIIVKKALLPPPFLLISHYDQFWRISYLSRQGFISCSLQFFRWEIWVNLHCRAIPTCQLTPKLKGPAICLSSFLLS